MLGDSRRRLAAWGCGATSDQPSRGRNPSRRVGYGRKLIGASRSRRWDLRSRARKRCRWRRRASRPRCRWVATSTRSGSIGRSQSPVGVPNRTTAVSTGVRQARHWSLSAMQRTVKEVRLDGRGMLTVGNRADLIEYRGDLEDFEHFQRCVTIQSKLLYDTDSRLNQGSRAGHTQPKGWHAPIRRVGSAPAVADLFGTATELSRQALWWSGGLPSARPHVR